MKKARVLFVSQDIFPYLDETPMGKIARQLPQGIQERGKEIRTFMPRYGNINERRHQLHEVIRLSGMNLIINDNDHPLIIKVASIQAARMQVYFIDNEDFFQRKSTLIDDKGKPHKDNDERCVFFNRGVIETVKKLGWQPDIIHCHGWFTGLMPLYIKKAFADNPLFADTKIIYSIYDDTFKHDLDKNFSTKVQLDGVTKSDIKSITGDSSHLALTKLAIDHADAIIYASEEINPDIMKHVKKSGKPVLTYKNEMEYLDAYNEFYDQILADSLVEEAV